MAGSGHNSGDAMGVFSEELKQIVEAIEHLDAEIADLNSSKSEKFKEAKGRGFDVKIIREILRLRKQDHSVRQEHDAILELYMQALGML